MAARVRRPDAPRWTTAAIARLLGGVAVAVMVWTFWLHAGGPGPVDLFGGVDRVNFMYLSTFTRASGLLLGAAAAFVWRPWRLQSSTWRRPGPHHVLDWTTRRDGARRGSPALVAARLHRRRGDADGRLRLPVAAPVGDRAGADGRARGRPSGGDRHADDPRLGAAGRRRTSQLRAVPLALAGVRPPRCHRRLRAPGGDRHGRHRGALREHVPLRRTAGAAGALGRWWRSAGEARGRPVLAAAGGVVLLAGCYVAVDPYDRAAGGADVEFGAPTPTTVVAAPAATAPPTLPLA